ncbi:acyl-CoA dehydrogenase family protein [Nocardia miyunensis]|uniref:acyl-CoA dehydrogenase family protein n=1 Tax=Nocardia miyunensis TaxID=282684 RepID=UPI0008334D3E|nr:acyl-CoA dehydrogenase family protein [Nocardia miyunensis]
MSSTATGFDTDTIQLLTRSLREVFTAHQNGSGVSAALAELGWDDVSTGDPATATNLLFTEQGRALAVSRLLDDVVLRELTSVLPRGTANRAVLYRHPGYDLLLGPLDGVTELVSIDAAGHIGLVDANLVTPRPIHGFDPGSEWLRIERIPDSEPLAAGTAGPRAVAAAHRALCAEIIGICTAALDSAVAHTSSRRQYGRELAAFQAVRHRLAEAFVAVAAAQAALDTAGEDSGARTAQLAKLRAGRTQADVMRHTVQVFGAMGLSQEHTLHRQVTRAAALDLLLGGHVELAEQIGADLLGGADLLRVVEI